MRRKIAPFKWVAVFLLLLGMAGALPAQAATVRGQLYRLVYNTRYPAPYIAVTLVNPTMGRSSPAYTDTNGMYYLFNVPPGSYTLEIWWSRDPSQPPLRYNIIVNNNPYTDIAPIMIQ